MDDINVFDLVTPPTHPVILNRNRNADTFGFTDLVWSEDGKQVTREDLPVPDAVTSWTEAIRYAAVEGVVLWAKPYEWELRYIRRRLSSVRTMAMREGLFIETKRDWAAGRIYFHIVADENDLWTRTPAVLPPP